MKKRFLFCAGLLMGAGLLFHSGNAMTVRAAEDVAYTNGLKKYFIVKEGYGHYNYEDVIIKTTEPIVRVTVNGREQDITAGEDFYNIWNATQKISKDGKQYVFRAIGDIWKMDNVLLTPNGKYVICCYVGDGNTLAAKKTVVVDKDYPYFSHIEDSAIRKTVTIKPMDATSDIVSFTVNGKKTSIKKGYTLKKKGKYTFMAKDRAGNKEEQTVYFKAKKIISPVIKEKETKISLKKCKLDEWNVYDTKEKKWETNKPAVYSGMTKYDRKTTEEMDKQAEEFYKTFNFQVKGDKWLNKDGSLKYKDPVSCNLARENGEVIDTYGIGLSDTFPKYDSYEIPDKKNKKKKNDVNIRANFKKNGKIYNLGDYGWATLRKGENVLHFAYPQGIVKVALVSYRNLSGKESYYDNSRNTGRSKNNIRVFTYKKPLKNFSITLEKQGYYTFLFYTKDMLENINDVYSKYHTYIKYNYLYIKDNPQANGFKSNMIKAISSWDYQEEWGTPDGGFNNINSGLRKMCREFTDSPYTMRVYKNNELYKDFENVTEDNYFCGTKAYDDFYYPKNVSTDDIWTIVVKDVCGNLTIYKNVRIKRGYELEATPKPTKKPHPTKKPRPTAWVTASPTATPSPTSTLPSTPTPNGN